MSTITVNITKSNIYSICEGVSVSIAQHNGGTPTYEQLWASADESRKLDIYYREAISDLERHLTEWIKLSSAQFNLTATGSDYALQLTMSPHWPNRLQGLLANKIQDYLVHAVTAGWLNDFDGLTTKQDYQEMAGQDVSDIRTIIEMREFNFTESARTDDKTAKDDSSTPSTEERTEDDTDKDDSSTPSTEQRTEDDTDKDDNLGFIPGNRQADADKEGPALQPEAGYRRKDNAVKFDNDEMPPYCRPQNLRHRDNAIVDTRSDWTDWSGTGIAYRDRLGYDPDMHMLPPEEMPPLPANERRAPLPIAGCTVRQQSHRVERGHGYTPSRLEHRPTPPTPPTIPTPPTHPTKPHPKDPRVPDFPTHPNYPPIHTDGKDWSDKELYDEEGSEHYINR